ncbi:metallophosphoesterase MPPED2-like [Babylonia areolata]|uniref:metallophosphoesterase MPPED2-like n=1 Tax=Babylonia areolata TaxID=304850 RepID=UPI003FD218A3
MANTFLQEKIKSLKGKKGIPKRKTDSVDSEGKVVIEVDPLTNRPTAAWTNLRESQTAHQLSPDTYLQRPRQDNVLRFVCLSDTHSMVEGSRRAFHERIPDGDVLIHCGDFSMGGDPSEIIQFDSFMGRLSHPVKLVIAGNHEMTFEDYFYGGHPVLLRKQLGLSQEASTQEVVAGCKALLQNSLYLEDEVISICGIKLYGSPWVPSFGSWGFSLTRGQNLLEKWNRIPSDTDILITHGPPCGYGDSVPGGDHAGCVELLNTVVKRVKPKFHVFGHIHSGYGMWSNGTTTFINSAICDNRYKAKRDPVVFDYPLPWGYTRQDFARLSTESLREARNTAAELSQAMNCSLCIDGSNTTISRKPPESDRGGDDSSQGGRSRTENGAGAGAGADADAGCVDGDVEGVGAGGKGAGRKNGDRHGT